MTNRTEVCSKEIGFIQNPEIKEIVTNLIQQLPEYFLMFLQAVQENITLNTL